MILYQQSSSSSFQFYPWDIYYYFLQYSVSLYFVAIEVPR